MAGEGGGQGVGDGIGARITVKVLSLNGTEPLVGLQKGNQGRPGGPGGIDRGPRCLVRAPAKTQRPADGLGAALVETAASPASRLKVNVSN